VKEYSWVDIGSSFLPSEISAAFLWAQLEQLEEIQQRRRRHSIHYDALLEDCEDKGIVSRPKIPKHAHPNAHSYHLLCRDAAMRSALIAFLKAKEVHSASHYRSLHRAVFFNDRHDGRALPHADRYTETLVRLPLYYELNSEDVARVCALVARWVDENGYTSGAITAD
jgi:dTDP-4-amino-4,6-dideoxygalactose transaminase